MKILFATSNESKVKRFSKELLDRGVEVISLKDIDYDVKIEENGKNAIENALIKARAYCNLCNMPVLAMDDNLYIENIPDDIQPGMFVRRVNGKRLSDDEMISYYTNLVKTYGVDGKLNCKWVYGLAVISNGIEYTYSFSKNDFYMVDTPSKIVNPGYPLNSISINKKLNKYFSEINLDDIKDINDDESDVIDFIINSINK